MKILIIPGLTLPRVTEEDLERVRAAAGEHAEIVVSGLADAIGHVEEADVVLGFVTREMFLASRRLRWVQAIASGVDAFLYEEFRDSDVVLTSEKGLVGEHLADHAFGLLLMLSRQLATALRLGPDAWNHRPEMRRQEFELTGRTMGVFGFGGTGRAVARRAAAFGMNVVALDRDPVPTTAEVASITPPAEFDRFLGASDVVAITCPLTEETRNRFDAEAFARMRNDAYLINVSRGEVMVEDALADALERGGIAGAGLDVAPREPLPADSRLWKLPNVVMTPHTAGASQFRAARNLERFVANLARFRAGEPLEGVVDKRLGY